MKKLLVVFLVQFFTGVFGSCAIAQEVGPAPINISQFFLKNTALTTHSTQVQEWVRQSELLRQHGGWQKSWVLIRVIGPYEGTGTTETMSGPISYTLQPFESQTMCLSTMSSLVHKEKDNVSILGYICQPPVGVKVAKSTTTTMW